MYNNGTVPDLRRNPIVFSPYVQQFESGNGIVPPSPQKALVTESGIFILTEGNKMITTE